jgi:hypothetical protein
MLTVVLSRLEGYIFYYNGDGMSSEVHTFHWGACYAYHTYSELIPIRSAKIFIYYLQVKDVILLLI